MPRRVKFGGPEASGKERASVRLRVRGPGPGGGYDLFLDDNKVVVGFGAQEAARYVTDAWLNGAAVFPEHRNGPDDGQAILPPDLTRALQSLGALPGAAQE